jgi:phosphoglycolate phosphatase
MIGDGARVLVERALGPGATDEDVDHARDLFLAAYTRDPVVHTTLLPGVKEVLALSWPSAVVTNKPRAIAALVVERLGLAPRFTALYGGGDGPLKPSPQGILTVCRQLGVEARDTWMIGDGPQDVLAGRAAGCFTIAVRGIADHARLLEAGPDLVVDSMLDVAERLSSPQETLRGA